MKKNAQNQIFDLQQEELKETDNEDRKRTMDVLTTHLELAIKTFVKFAKSIPGFCNLPLNDQASMIKCKTLSLFPPPFCLRRSLVTSFQQITVVNIV